jgi:hypothetical protein
MKLLVDVDLGYLKQFNEVWFKLGERVYNLCLRGDSLAVMSEDCWTGFDVNHLLEVTL